MRSFFGGSGRAKDFGTALQAAREAWMRALRPYANSLGVIQLPHPAPMLGEEHLEDCVVLPSREAILRRMKRGSVCAEVGVQTGIFSRSILDICSPSRLHLIDLDHATYSIATKFRTEIESGTVRLHEGDSSSVLAEFPDEYFDFIYVDGDHQYEGVRRDIEAGKSKVKPAGFLVFNDYTYWSPVECMPYGVIQAVNELCLEGGWKMKYFALAHYMYCDVALSRG
jgi:hypothetical protein